MEVSKKEKRIKVFIIILGILLFIHLLDYKLPYYASGGIEDNLFVLAVGIDKSEQENKTYKLTALGEKLTSESNNTDKTSKKSEDVCTTEGQTIFQALRSFNLFKGKSLEWSHLQYIVISEELAKDNILDILDTFIRHESLRLNAKIIIIKECSAESFLRSGDKLEEYIPDLITSLFNNEFKTSVSTNVSLVEFVRIVDDKYVDLYVPNISLLSRVNDKPEFQEIQQVNKKQEIEINNKEEMDNNEDSSGGKDSEHGKESDKSKKQYYLSLDGFAVFKSLKLYGFLVDGHAKGLNWLKGNTKNATIALEDVKGSKLTVEVLQSKIKKDIKFDGDIPEITYDITFSTNISEIESQQNFINKEMYQLIKEKQNEKVKEQIELAIKYAKENELDIFNLSNDIYKKDPKRWDKIKDNWRDIFKDINMKVNVESKINRTYHINQPIRSGYGDSK